MPRNRAKLAQQIAALDTSLKHEDIHRMRTLEMEMYIQKFQDQTPSKKKPTVTSKVSDRNKSLKGMQTLEEVKSPENKNVEDVQNYTLVSLPEIDPPVAEPEGLTGQVLREHSHLMEEIKELQDLLVDQSLEPEDRGMAEVSIQRKMHKLHILKSQTHSLYQKIQHQLDTKQKLYRLMESDRESEDRQRLQNQCTKLQTHLRILHVIQEQNRFFSLVEVGSGV